MKSFGILLLFVVNLILCCCIIFPTVSAGSSVLEGITKCRYDDSNCLQTTVQHFMKNFAKTGIRELNLLPFDPLHINSLKLEKNNASPVTVEFKFKDLDIYGLQEANLLQIKGFDADIKKKIELKMQIPKMSLKGRYSVDGRVLILPIVGKGNAAIDLIDLRIAVNVQPKGVEKSGHIHLEMDSIKLDLMPKKVTFNLEGLFNGNKELSDTMNSFLNENWEDIFNELKVDISTALGQVIKHIFNGIFAKYPFDVYFLN